MLYRQGWWLIAVDLLREPLRKVFGRSETTGKYKGLVESSILYLASSIANVLSYPWEVARIRMMVDQRHRYEKPLYKNPSNCLREVWNNQGVRGWYAGLTISLLQNILTIATARWVHPKIEQHESIPSDVFIYLKLALSFSIA